MDIADVEAWSKIGYFLSRKCRYSFFDVISRREIIWVPYPDFTSMRLCNDEMSTPLNVLFTLFRQGLPVSEEILRRTIDHDALESMLKVGLLVCDPQTGDIKTQELVIVPFFGRLFLTPMHHSYPIGKIGLRKGVLSREQVAMTNLLPLRMDDKIVHVANSTPGLYAIEAAARGGQVHAFEDASLMELLAANALLNGIQLNILPNEKQLVSTNFHFAYCVDPAIPLPPSLLPYHVLGKSLDGHMSSIINWLNFYMSNANDGAESYLMTRIVGGLDIMSSALYDILVRQIQEYKRGLEVVITARLPIAAFVMQIVKDEICSSGYSERYIPFREIVDDWAKDLRSSFEDPCIYDVTFRVINQKTSDAPIIFNALRADQADTFARLVQCWR